MVVFVTGGAGFIGSCLTRRLIALNIAQVVNIDKLTYASNLDALESVKHSPNYHFEQLDLVDGDALSTLFDKYQPDAVFHLAAESHVDRSLKSPDNFIQTNILGTYQLLEACRHYLASRTQAKSDFTFLHVSTDEVYGDLALDAEPASEEAAIKASSPYSATKAAAEQLVMAWGRSYRIPYIISRCSNNYGPWQYHEKLIPFFIWRALLGQSLPIYGKGDQLRDWLHVEDHVSALIELFKRGERQQSYNISGGFELTNRQLVGRLCDELCQLDHASGRPKHDYPMLVTEVADRPGHDRRYALNSDKIYRDTGWRPQIDFQTGFKETVHWFYQRLNQAGHQE